MRKMPPSFERQSTKELYTSTLPIHLWPLACFIAIAIALSDPRKQMSCQDRQ